MNKDKFPSVCPQCGSDNCGHTSLIAAQFIKKRIEGSDEVRSLCASLATEREKNAALEKDIDELQDLCDAGVAGMKKLTTERDALAVREREVEAGVWKKIKSCECYTCEEFKRQWLEHHALDQGRKK